MLRSLALAAALILLADAAAAQLIVYRGSGSCAANSTPGTIPIGGSTSVLVCFDDPGGGAPTAGQECVGGTADEVCGVDVEIRTTGSVTMTGFTPSGDWVYNLTPTLLKANGGNPLTGDAAPTAIGTINVSATGAGTLEVTGKHWVDSTLALQTVAPVVLASAAISADFDGDGLANEADACATIVNSGTDSDGDGVDDVCDTCTSTPNAPVGGAVPTNRTLVSRQYDDDADGRGNACDFDYNNSGLTVTTTDFNDAKGSQGKSLTAVNCGAAAPGGSGNTQRCYEFDHVPGGLTVTVDDFNAAKAAQGKSMSLYPKCAACLSPFSRPADGSLGAPLAGKPVCEAAGTGSCPY